ncbi:type VII toxin-antitoxin system HepT family RNase toxin [Pseudomonas sp. TWR1-1-4]|uniref:type VII toxin-antitoxin system HepT family RNase toxin n=1 Tax=Pseudomonas sp. TWR1-1-4 TaxID=2804604 RepID=UPI003CF0D68C
MVDDVLIHKASSIERCVARAREEYDKDPDSFATDLTRQDAAILNIQRACEAALDMGQHLIRRERLGVPQGARDVFQLLSQGGWVSPSLLTNLKNMVGFRNIAVHEYQTLQLPITVAIITQHLGDFLAFSSFILTKDASQSGATTDTHPK